MGKLETRVYNLEATLLRFMLQIASGRIDRDDIYPIMTAFLDQTERLDGITRAEIDDAMREHRTKIL